MKALIALSLLILAISASYSEQEATQIWKEWRMIHNKVYENQLIERFRYVVFKNNLELIDQLQSEDDSAQYGPTVHADLTPEEFEQRFLNYQGYKADNKSQAVIEPSDDTPDTWDWTEHKAVSHVKDQGSCGSCWAFSAVGNIEGQNMLKHSDMQTLSEQQLVDCDQTDQGCNGGWTPDAFTWLIENGGIMNDTDYPYTAKKGTCVFDETKAVAKLLDYRNIAQKDEGAMKSQLYNYGPLSVALNASSLQFYMKGIYNPLICKNKEKDLNHGVTLVGYGIQGRKDFWKCKNSWGTGWGEQGFFRIKRGKNECGIAMAACYSIIE